MPFNLEPSSRDLRCSQGSNTNDDDDDDNDKRIAAALALRSFHLPGYSLVADWWQYMVNHHPLWGICCHHRLHPLEFKMRVLYLVGSVMFGLAITNTMWLAFLWSEGGVDENQTFLSVRYGAQDDDATESGYHPQSDEDAGLLFQNNGEIVITQGMVLLWTVGGTLHALFDQTIWFITTCPCCLPGQPLQCCLFARQYTRFVAAVAVVMATAIATLAVVLRASLQVEVDEQPSNTTTSTTTSLEDFYYQGRQRMGEIQDQQQSITAYDFLVTYGIELSLSYLLYYPLLGTLFFSGILGCYRIPILGGRPFELRQEERRKQRRQNSWRR